MSEFENLKITAVINSPLERGRGVFLTNVLMTSTSNSSFVPSKSHFVNILILIIFLAVNITTQAQNNKIEANATINPKEIKIGEQVQMKVVVKYPKSVEVFWPEISDKITVDSSRQVDVTAQSKTDTTIADNVITQSRTITITAFDPGSYAIPPLVFGYREGSMDSIKQSTTLPMLLSVVTLPVDTAQAIRPEKGQIDLPFTWREIKGWIISGGILLAILLAIGIYFFTRKKQELIFVERKQQLPAHLEALQKLQLVEAEKYWQQGDVKKYYSSISDIVREYIERRYRILALESTTYELMTKMNNTNSSGLDKMNLRELLELCDVVKFAKVEPMPDEHAKAILIAREFVQHTMVPETPAAENNLPQ